MKNIISQIFPVFISIFLAFTFFVLLAGALATGQNFMTDMILIIIAIILLAMFSTLNKIEFKLGGRKG